MSTKCEIVSETRRQSSEASHGSEHIFLEAESHGKSTQMLEQLRLPNSGHIVTKEDVEFQLEVSHLIFGESVSSLDQILDHSSLNKVRTFASYWKVT